MRIIENYSNKLDSVLGLIQNVPTNLLSKLGISLGGLLAGGEMIEVIILSPDTPENLKSKIEAIGGTYENLGFSYGIVKISLNKIIELASIPTIQYIELPKELYTVDYQSNRAACVNTARNKYNIQGEGVVIGFIDSGIDFTHPAFKNEDGTSRIDYIYDLNDGGKIYNNEDINNALKVSDPYSIVKAYDETGHGTHVAGIACAGGNINSELYGVAPKSSIMMVKSTRGRFAISTNIMRGLRFLVNRSLELNKPLVVNISLSTNDGAHNGTSLLEQYISTILTLERVTIVIAAGNEGDASHHVGGELQKENRISINVASDERNLVINLYNPVLSDVSIRIISPTGASSGDIFIREGFFEGILGVDRYQIYYSGPKPFDIIGEITIAINTSGQYISAGQWEVILTLNNQYSGNFDMWLPISESLNQSTKFLQPTISNTLGIPATVQNIIAVGSYNYLTNNISPFSGRGRETLAQYIRPDVVAPGEDIISTAPNRSFDSKSGTSMATPHVSGIAALMMEWGVVKKNDLYLHGERLKYYLVVSAKRPRTDISYPNITWGYGEVCLDGAMERLISNIGIIGTRDIFGSRQELQSSNTSVMKSSLNKYLSSVIDRDYRDYNEITGFLVEYISKDMLEQIKKFNDVSFTIIDNNFAIVFAPFNKILEIEPYVRDIVSIEIPTIYTLQQVSPVEASSAPLFHNNPFLELTGQGVIVGIIDTGIDYLNKEFIKEDDTTRILRIWDQSIEGDREVYEAKLGVEYTEAQINEAITASKNGQDPYSIVNSKDNIGHGTAVASLVGARGANPELIGAAPQCSFAIVKLKEAPQVILDFAGVSKPGVGRYTTIEVYLAVRYLSKVANELGKPIVICIPVGSNTGAHDGTNAIETAIDAISKQVGFLFVAGTGNGGDTDTHTEGKFSKSGEIKNLEVRMDKAQKDLNFQIYIQQPDRVSLGVVSPSGEVIEKINARIDRVENIKFIYEGTSMRISYLYPDVVTGAEVINIEARNLKEGIWQFRLYGDYIVDGRYWSWLPQRELLESETKFLSPSQYTTLTIPSTSITGISAAYYNQNNNATVGQSGRGFTRDGRIKPDIAAGGINALVTAPGGGTRVISGSSVATAVTSGCCALIMQWGIVKGNDPRLYATEIRTYLIRGANMRIGDIYPNEQWGYGTLDIKGVFDAIRENLTGGVSNTREINNENLE